MTFLLLFLEFFKTGLFAIGGGMATLPFLNEMANKYPWFTVDDVSDMIAVSESTPGPIGVNMATYAGYTTGYGEFGILGGILGALVATVGLVLPSLLIILIVARILEKFQDSKLVKDAFYTLRPAVTALIAVAGISIIKVSLVNIELFTSTNNITDLFNVIAIIMFAVILFMQLFVKKIKLHPIVYIVVAAVIGIIFKM
ncbi:MAG: chromate transporter [Ruminococcaceae bacterium]|nr:chromate transporter [Oscillospiraceae bacterium]